MKTNSGQVLVFVMLIMLLGLTVGLSITSRTLQDLKQTTITDQSSRAFTAAEAGIEEALSTNLGVGSYTASLPTSDINVTYTVSSEANSYTSATPILKDDVTTINLDGFSGSLKVSWQMPAESPSSLELSFYGVNGAEYFVKKYAYNPVNCGASPCPSNNFETASAGSSGYISSVTFASVPVGSKLLRIRPVYANTSIKVEATGTGFPGQNYTITSTAVTNGNVERSVQVEKSNTGLPPFFDYVLFSPGGGIGKN